MKKRLTMALAAVALMVAMLPGVASAGEKPDFGFFIQVPGNNQLGGDRNVGVPEVAAMDFRNN